MWNRRHSEARFVHAVALPGLRGGMIDFEHPHPQEGMWIAQREVSSPAPRITTWRMPPGYGRIEAVLGKTASGRHEHPHLPLRGISRNRFDQSRGIGAKHNARYGIPENAASVEDLMCGALDRGGERRTTGLTVLHATSPISHAPDCAGRLHRT